MDAPHIEALATLDPVILGGRIRAARVAARMTQPELGLSDASAAYVSRIEKGERRPGAHLVDLFAERLGVSVEDLVFGRPAQAVDALELELNRAELELTSGHAETALDRVAGLLADPLLDKLPGGSLRARFLRASARDALGLPEAVDDYSAVVAEDAGGSLALKASAALSRVLRERGDFQMAVDAAQRGLNLAEERSLDETEDSVRLSVTLAAALYETGDAESSEAVCRSAIKTAELLESPGARAAAYWNMSVIEYELGNVAAALELSRKALYLFELIGSVRDTARLRTHLATIMLDRDGPALADAREQVDLAEAELITSAASPADRARNAIALARCQLAAEQYEAAQQVAEDALEQAGSELPLVQAAALCVLGQVAWHRGDRKGSRTEYAKAIQALTSVGNDREAARIWFDLGELASLAGMGSEATEAFRVAATLSGAGRGRAV